MNNMTISMAADRNNECNLQGFEHFLVAAVGQVCVRPSSVVFRICIQHASQSAICIFNYHRFQVSLIAEIHGFPNEL